MVASPCREVAVRFEPRRSALVRSALVRSRRASPYVMLTAAAFEALRLAWVRLASAKSMVAPCALSAMSFEPLRSAWARLDPVKSMREAS